MSGFVQGEVAMSIAVVEPGSILFTGDSTMIVFDGCTSRTVSVEVSDGSTGGPVQGDGEIQFGSAQTGADDTSECSDVVDYVQAFNQTFASGDATYTIDGQTLTVVGRDGAEMTLSVRE